MENQQLAVADTANQLPAHIRQIAPGEQTGMELMNSYVVPPRLKFVQPQSKPELKKQFGEGTLITVPAKTLVAGYDMKNDPKGGEPITFVPLMFYPEFLCFNPLTLAGQLPTVRERSLDPKSQTAAKCKARVEFKCPESQSDKDLCKYVESLNFVVMLMNHELFGTPCIMPFQRGEFKTGSNFCTAIKLRCGRTTHMYSCQFQAAGGHRENTQGNWYGFDITNPTTISGVSPWVDGQEMFDYIEATAKELRATYDAGLLVADYDDEPIDTVAQANVVDMSAEV